MKKVMFVILFLSALLNLEAVKNSCVGDDCKNSDFINISELNKRDVFEALYNCAAKKAGQFFLDSKINHQLTEDNFNQAEHILGWNIEIFRYAAMWVDLSPDIIDVRTFNNLYGDNAAQKALKPLKSQKVLLS